MSPPTARSTSPPHSSGCSAAMTPAKPHRKLWRSADGAADSCTPRVTIQSAAGLSGSRSAKVRTRPLISAEIRTAKSTSVSPALAGWESAT